DLSTYTYTAKLDGLPWHSLDPITAEGPHTITVHAVDAPGNFSDAQVQILIDKSAPVITLTESGQPLASSYKRNIAIDIKVTDALTAVTYTATLDGAPYVSGAPITAEGSHVLLVSAKDNVGNPASVQAKVLVDKSAPQIAFYESNNKVDSTTAKFKTDAHIEIRVTDAVSTATYTATLDGNPYKSLDAITADGTPKLVGHPSDEAGNVTDASLNILIDKTAPIITFFDGTTPLDPRTTQKFRRDVAIDIKATDAISSATFTATLDGQPYNANTLITSEATHHIAVH